MVLSKSAWRPMVVDCGTLGSTVTSALLDGQWSGMEMEMWCRSWYESISRVSRLRFIV